MFRLPSFLLLLRGRSSYSKRLLRHARLEVELAPLVSIILPGPGADEITEPEAPRRPEASVDVDGALAAADRAVGAASRALVVAQDALKKARGIDEPSKPEVRQRRRR